ncbi:heavy metal-binding domain-containing protein [Clostridium sp. MCC353]|uniref:YbjQ family protein n=1 Tax=Clostridium sp. MCC353 TaxID=2592646 RepID=UPI001C017DF7|nr:YbjQ family protein [Clostridium sp. MCC353]MBT9775850.1 heavy metal-binding domain-containing protein [Clostridium sp. MCC353]
MMLVTTETINGKEFEMLGLVKGSSIMTVHAGKDIMNSFKTLVGGELTSYNEMMEKARALATERLISQAEALGADAVVTVRYNSSSVAQGAAEVMAYGTAVKFL